MDAHANRPPESASLERLRYLADLHPGAMLGMMAEEIIALRILAADQAALLTLADRCAKMKSRKSV